MKKIIIITIFLLGLFLAKDAKATVTWLTPSDVSPTGSGWVDVDVSASVPAGATGVIVHIVNSSGYAATTGVRKNGSTDSRTWTGTGGGAYQSHQWAVIGVDANRIFEANVGPAYYLVGYFGSESAFFTNAVDKTLGSTDAYVDIDISADTGADTAIGVFIEMWPAWETFMAARMNGSTDDIYYYRYCPYWMAVGVDGSEIFEGKVSNTGSHFFLNGYMKSGATFLTNATNMSLGGTAAWTDLTALPAGATGGFFHVIDNGFSYGNYGLRKNGSSEDIYQRLVLIAASAFVEADASQLIEGEIAGTGTDFYLTGYTTGGGGVVTPGTTNSTAPIIFKPNVILKPGVIFK